MEPNLVRIAILLCDCVVDIKTVLIIPGAVTVTLCFTAPTFSINTKRPPPTGLMMTSRSRLILRRRRRQSTGTNWRGFCEEKIFQIFSENKYSIYWV